MGYNTTVVILNDALDSIAKDPDFGRRLADEIKRSSFRPDTPNDVSAGGFCNAALIIESHHSSDEVAVIVGHNTGRVQTPDAIQKARDEGYEAGHEAGRTKKAKTLEARVTEVERALRNLLRAVPPLPFQAYGDAQAVLGDSVLPWRQPVPATFEKPGGDYDRRINPGTKVRLRAIPAAVGVVDGWVGPRLVRIRWEAGHHSEVVEAYLDVIPQPQAGEPPQEAEVRPAAWRRDPARFEKCSCGHERRNHDDDDGVTGDGRCVYAGDRG